MEPVEYLRILRRRWGVVVVAVLLGATAAWATAPTGEAAEPQRTYEATHTLYRDPAAPQQHNITMDTVALLATTGEIPRRVAERMGTSAEPAVLASRVEVVPNQQLGTLTIASRDRDGERAAELANAFAEETVRYFDERDAVRREEATARLTRTLETQETQIRELDARLAGGIEGTAAFELVRAERDALIRQYGYTIERAQEQAAHEAAGSGLVTLQAATPIPIVEGGFQPPRSREGRAGMGALLAGLLGIGLAFALDRLDIRIRTRRGAATSFGLPVLAEVPRLTPWRRQGVVTAERPASYAAEAFRILRLSLQITPRMAPGPTEGPAALSHSWQPGKNGKNGRHAPKVILVTSAGPSEGKTTTAANLAASFAEIGKRVLLVDADFRHAEQHRYFGAERSPGVSDYLRIAGASLADFIQPTNMPGVAILPNGTPVDNPGELLGPDQQLLTHAAKLADVVVVDVGPLLSVNDPAALMPQVDAVALVARSGKTSAEAAYRTSELLARMHAPVTGVVLLGVPRSQSSQPYYAQTRSVPAGLRRIPWTGSKPDRPARSEVAEQGRR
jgi:capsular exopolysaccharide synthesis family protein